MNHCVRVHRNIARMTARLSRCSNGCSTNCWISSSVGLIEAGQSERVLTVPITTRLCPSRPRSRPRSSCSPWQGHVSPHIQYLGSQNSDKLGVATRNPIPRVHARASNDGVEVVRLHAAFHLG